MRVCVTQPLIDAGKRASPCGCPVALALAAAMPSAEPSVLSPLGFFCGPWIERKFVGFPAEERVRIATYDKTGVMEVHEFEVEVPTS